MKILAINGSPRGATGNTAKLTEAFLEGATEMGAIAETVYLFQKHIEPCCGSFVCWMGTPGQCCRKDDMADLLEKELAADILIFATPLYTYTVSGLMKHYMDRRIPTIQPFISLEGGVSHHPRRYPGKGPLPVVISNCGFPEQSHFSGMKETFRQMFAHSGHSLATMICCAGGELLRQPEMRETNAWYIDAVRQAGREVVQQGRILSETQAVLDKPLVDDSQIFVSMANAAFLEMGCEPLGEEATRVAQGTVPAPAPSAGTHLDKPTGMETVRDIVAGMVSAFNQDAAKDLQAVIQFVVKDENPGRYYLDIHGGQCAAYAGVHPNPRVTITTPANVWIGIANGKMNGMTAFMTRKYTIEGDLRLMMRFESLFKPCA